MKNKVAHPYYKQYFDKEPGVTSHNFQMHYGGTSANALPGIVDVKERPTRKEYYKLNEPDHANLVQLANETRMPIDHIKG